MSDGPHLDPCDCDMCKYAAQGAWGRRNAPTNQPVPLELEADAPTHLPECLSDEFASWKIEECICDRLRACEERVREEVNAEWWGKSPYQQGVAAAREAVAAEALTDNTGDPADAAYMEGINDALAAIDGLVKP